MKLQLDPKHPQFDWFQVLRWLQADGSLTDREFEALECAASLWATCACGQLCQRLPRTEHGTPHDRDLFLYGIQFHHDIRNKCWAAAYQTLELIEARSAYLLGLSKDSIP